jgi:hypothetical protein
MIADRKVTLLIMRFVTYCFLFCMLVKGISVIVDVVQMDESELEIDFTSEKKVIDCNYNLTTYLFATCLGAVLNTLIPIKMGVM